ncbi:hypothetical protein E2C01_040624 [Portunus trituberculatus]|uniref:CUB domain-containing protein n=1 Tax=Portunus trituberculatus TaxID=210409 RepID=A0A5B7FP96_PORTR|nr:hypothetical protein [Portunus trituberculatus]
MMKVLYALLVVAAAATAGVVLASELSHRDERILFASNPLVCDGDAGHQGACLPYFRCESYGGTVEGTCRVVGQCCVVVVDVEGMEGPFKVSVTTLEENLDSEWEVKVVQVPCNSDDLGSRHLQESYTICVRAENDYCGVKWTSPSDSSEDEYDFTLTGNLAPAGMDPVFGSGLNEDCAFTDYLLITDASVVGEEFPTTVLCGSHFPSPGLYSKCSLPTTSPPHHTTPHHTTPTRAALQPKDIAISP